MSAATAAPPAPADSHDVPPLPSLIRSIMRLGAPAVVENLIAASIFLTDMLMLARLDNNSVYLAAAGLTSVWLWRIVNVAGVTQIGTGAYVARRWGEERYDEAGRGVTHALVLCLGVGLVVSVAMIPILRVVSDFYLDDIATRETAYAYFLIVLIGLPARIAYFTAISGMRAAGDTRTPVLLVTVMLVVNVFLNWVFIYGNLGAPAMLMEGAAVATAASFWVAFIGAVLLLARGVRPRRLFPANEGQPVSFGGEPEAEGEIVSFSTPKPDDSGTFRLRRDGLRLRIPGVTEPILRVSWPALWEEILVSIGFLTFFKMVASFGSEVLAAHSACLRIESFSFTAGWGVAIATSAMVGQALGARKVGLAKRLFSLNTTITMSIMGIAGLVMVLVPTFLLGLFRLEQPVMDIATMLLFIVAMEQSMMGATMTLGGGLRGAGDTFPPFVVQLVGTIGMRVGFGYLLGWTFGMGIEGVYWATAIDWTVRAIVLLFFVLRGRWQTIKV